MMPSTILRKIRIRRLVQAAEKRSGLKHDKTVFRDIVEDTSTTTGTHAADLQRDLLQYQQPKLTMTLTEDSEDSEVAEDDCDEVQFIDKDTKLAKPIGKVLSSTVEASSYERQIQEKESIIQKMTLELDRVRQDDVDVIVDLAAKQQEIAALTEKLEKTETELSETKLVLSDTKEKLRVVSSALIQAQYDLLELQNKRNVVLEGFSKLGHTAVGYWK